MVCSTSQKTAKSHGVCFVSNSEALDAAKCCSRPDHGKPFQEKIEYMKGNWGCEVGMSGLNVLKGHGGGGEGEIANAGWQIFGRAIMQTGRFSVTCYFKNWNRPGAEHQLEDFPHTAYHLALLCQGTPARDRRRARDRNPAKNIGKSVSFVLLFQIEYVLRGGRNQHI